MIDDLTIARALGGEVRNGEILAPGPGHSAADRSLSVKLDKDAPDGFVVFSFAGDDPIACRDYVRDRLGLPKWKPNGAGTAKKAKATGVAAAAKPYSPTVATFVYRDQEGRPYLRVQRTTDKQFFQSHWEDETWKPGAPKGPKLPYLLPALFAAAPNMPVYITEGEGKADLLAKLGFIATSASGGAGKWTADLNKWFANRPVRILIDNDEPGRKHGQLVARNLDGVAAEVRVVDLPGLPPKGDVKQWLETDPTGARLVQACERAPLWEPVTLVKLRTEMAADEAKDKAKDKAKTEVDETDGAVEEHESGEAEAGLYRLKDVLQAVERGLPIAVVKEEKEVDALWEIGVPATTNVVEATNGGHTALHEHLHGADIILVPNEDEAGYAHIEKVATALVTIVKRIRVLRLAPNKGVSDWLEAGGSFDQWRMLIELAPDWVPPASFVNPAAKAEAEAEERELLSNLALMNELDYDRQRKAAAKRLGIRESTLDRTRDRRRAELDEERGAPPLFGYWLVEPWEDAVEGDDLIRRIIARIRRHVVLRENQAIVAALWILLTWVHEAAVHSPILLINSPERDSGKSTLADLIRYLVRRGLSAVGLTGAVLYRTIELHDVTFIVDEADHLLATNEDVKTVVNSGWTRGMVILRCVGDAQVPTPFSSFCPKLIAMKGRHLHDTTRSRCLPIALKPRKKSETAEPFESEDDEGLKELRRRAMRWAMDNVEALKGVRPAMPEELFNRRGANWRLIFAIADRAGSEWPQRVREAALEVSGVKEHADKSTGEQLLADIKTLREERVLKKEVDHAFIETEEILNFLHAMEDRSWSEFGKHEKPITSTKLAGILSGYGVTPVQFRDKEGKKKRGYIISHFDDPFERYPA